MENKDEKMNELMKTELFEAVEEGRIHDLVELLSSPGVDVNERMGKHRHYGGYSLLHLACDKGYSEIVQILVQAKANLNIRDQYSQTPIGMAYNRKHFEIVHILLESGADANVEYSGKPLLHDACENGQLDMMQALLKSKANVNMQDQKGETPLHFASMKKNAEIVRILLDAGADPNIQSKKGETPLCRACKNNYVEIVRILLDAGADLNIQSNWGWTPLHYACRNERGSEVAKMLIGKGADINVKTKKSKDSRLDHTKMWDYDTPSYADAYENLPDVCIALDIAAFFSCSSCMQTLLSTPGLDFISCQSAAKLACDSESSKLLQKYL